MQIKPTLDHIPVFELSEFDLPEIQTNNTLEYGENPVSKASVLRKEITNVSDEFLQRWHEHVVPSYNRIVLHVHFNLHALAVCIGNIPLGFIFYSTECILFLFIIFNINII